MIVIEAFGEAEGYYLQPIFEGAYFQAADNGFFLRAYFLLKNDLSLEIRTKIKNRQSVYPQLSVDKRVLPRIADRPWFLPD